MPTDRDLRAFELVAKSDDPKKLKIIAKNAAALGATELVRAAELRLFDIMPAEAPGTLEHDVWRSIFALESVLTSERNKTTRLGRTRPKIARVGELETVRDLVLATKPSEGFEMLVQRRMIGLTFEAVALRHRDNFDERTLAAASMRLQGLVEAGLLSNNEYEQIIQPTYPAT